MSRDTHPRKTSSDFSVCSTHSHSGSTKTMRSRGVTFSGSQLAGQFESGLGLEESGRFNSFNVDTTSSEHAKHTMKTRIAVRDKNPHRFQVVPLRDASKLQAAVSQAENASRLTMPTPPTNYLLQSPSGKLSPYSQSRLLHSSVPAQSLPGNPRKGNRNSEESYLELNVHSTLAASGSKSLFASPSSLPSFSRHSQEEKMLVLTELDMNRERSRPFAGNPNISHLSPNRSSHKVVNIQNPPSKDSVNEPGHSDLRLTHATSRSLHLKPPQERNHPRFTSLANFQDFRTAQGNTLSEMTGTFENNGKTRESGFMTQETKDIKFDLSSSPDTLGFGKKSKSKKRHAIYTASLFLPGFDKLDYSDGTSNNGNYQPFPDPRPCEVARQHALFTPFQLDLDHTIRPALDSRLSDQDTSQSTIRDPLELRTWGMDLLPFDGQLHHSSPNLFSAALPFSRGLSYRKPSRPQPKVDPTAGNIVYPKIILDLFLEIDKAIEEWNPLEVSE